MLCVRNSVHSISARTFSEESERSEEASRGMGYSDAELASLPEGADLGLGCGGSCHRLEGS